MDAVAVVYYNGKFTIVYDDDSGEDVIGAAAVTVIDDCYSCCSSC